jgi:hypothetical protein
MTNRKVTNTYVFSERDIHVKKEQPATPQSVQNGPRFTPYPVKGAPSMPSYPALVILTIVRSNVHCWHCGSRVHPYSSHERLIYPDSQEPSTSGEPTETPSPNDIRFRRHSRWFLPLQSQVQSAFRQIHGRFYPDESGRTEQQSNKNTEERTS